MPTLEQLWLATYTSVLTGRTAALHQASRTFARSYADAVRDAIKAADFAVDNVKERT